jgi:hypothetical protein
MANTTVLAAARQAASTMLFSRHLHVFLLPQPMDSLAVDGPTGSNQQFVDSRATETGTSPGQPTHRTQQLWFVGRLTGLITVRAARLIQNPARPAF